MRMNQAELAAGRRGGGRVRRRLPVGRAGIAPITLQTWHVAIAAPVACLPVD